MHRNVQVFQGGFHFVADIAEELDQIHLILAVIVGGVGFCGTDGGSDADRGQSQGHILTGDHTAGADGGNVVQSVGVAEHGVDHQGCILGGICQDGNLLTSGIVQIDDEFFHIGFSFIVRYFWKGYRG